MSSQDKNNICQGRKYLPGVESISSGESEERKFHRER